MDGEICDLSELTMSAHSGTHLDAPAHFVNGDKSIDQYQLTDFIRSVRVVATKDLVSLKSAEISELTIPPGSGALSKTENSESDAVKAGHFSETYVYISAEAAHVCVAWNPSVIGIDCISIENDNDKNFPTHRAILGAGIPVLDGIDLAGMEPGNYTLFCPP